MSSGKRKQDLLVAGFQLLDFRALLFCFVLKLLNLSLF